MHINPNEPFFDVGERFLPACLGRTITLLLDKTQRIAFAGSGIQTWLGYDYETLPGFPITSLIPDLHSYPEWEKYCSDRTRHTHKTWSMLAFARHMDGRYLPVVVTKPLSCKALSALPLQLTPMDQT